MKKVIGVFLLGLLLISSFSFVLAVEANTDVDANTEREVKVMHNTDGATMRFLQLAEAIELRIAWMEETVTYLDEKEEVSEEDINSLKGMIEELKLLKAEAEGYEVSNMDAAVEKFIQIKTDARAIVLEFRSLARTFLTEEDKEYLRGRFQEAKEGLVEFRERIKQKRMNYNAERTQAVLDKMGVEDAALVEQVRNGELTAAQVKEKLRTHYNAADQTKKKELRTQLANAATARANAIRSNVQAYAQDAAATTAARAQQRAGNLRAASAEWARTRAAEIENGLGVSANE
jgi:hypothetical protein